MSSLKTSTFMLLCFFAVEKEQSEDASIEGQSEEEEEEQEVEEDEGIIADEETNDPMDNINSAYEGCSLILVIDSFSPKPSFIPEENYLLVEEWFFVILKSPNYFKMIQLIMAN